MVVQTRRGGLADYGNPMVIDTNVQTPRNTRGPLRINPEKVNTPPPTVGHKVTSLLDGITPRVQKTGNASSTADHSTPNIEVPSTTIWLIIEAYLPKSLRVQEKSRSQRRSESKNLGGALTTCLLQAWPPRHLGATDAQGNKVSFKASNNEAKHEAPNAGPRLAHKAWGNHLNLPHNS
uniref:Uncharacterized protein n=1 Tax=Cannabis sativa TaxID=3483 RepID=A0A803PK71_CANSA